MRKLFYLLGLMALVAVMPLKTTAQELHFMPKIGFTLADISHLQTKVRSGANVGLGAEYLFPNEIAAVETGVYYAMQGAYIKGTVAGHYLTTFLKNDYLNIPVLAKAYVYNGINVFVGPQFSFNVKDKITMEYGGKELGKVNTTDFVENFDLAIMMGVGYQFESGLFVNANYNLGLLAVFKEDEFTITGENAAHTITDGLSTRNRVFQISAGWRF
ncbi:MAG TPA: PorT family protein [Candidatus Parabacteroides intestinipullorum]|uniref:PorT family protein n=1 Tax=Candidatus Parabacteroides intestinipullorum TaxID=2838723 RepID=A0A9D1X672_9BACT|nr:PorT family protein [Candidatus Parabacteroides intestinipullorum]